MTRRPWTPAERAVLRRLYPDTPTREIAGRLGRTERAIYAEAKKQGLHKSAGYVMAQATAQVIKAGAKTRFKTGQAAWNKGTHFDPGGRSAETRFKKGHRGGRAAERYQPIGAERLTKDGYRQRKVNDDLPLQRRWKMVHHLVWEEHNGPVPDGHALTFRDGDRVNCDIDNLALVRRTDLMRRNTVHRLPEDLVEVVRLKARVTRQINKRDKA